MLSRTDRITCLILTLTLWGGFYDDDEPHFSDEILRHREAHPLTPGHTARKRMNPGSWLQILHTSITDPSEAQFLHQ